MRYFCVRYTCILRNYFEYPSIRTIALFCTRAPTEESRLLNILRSMAAHKRGTYQPEMPRHLKTINQARGRGVELKASPSLSILLVSNGHRRTGKSLMLRTDYRHYLFGCGEGTQRILMELSTKFVKTNQVLLTNSSWNQAGGLLGFMLSLDTSTANELTLHAPCHIQKWVEFNREHDNFRHLSVAQHDYSQIPVYKDESVTIKQIMIDSFDSANSCCKISNNGQDTPSEHRMNQYCAYIIDTNPLPPRLAIEKCVLLGVPANNLRRQLKEGRSVTLTDGRVVNPEDVIVPGHPQIRILMLDIGNCRPQSQSIRSQLEAVRSSMSEQRTPDYVVHFAESRLQRCQDYADFMTEWFDEKSVRHICLDEEVGNVESGGIFKMQSRLNEISSEFFPLMPCQLSAKISTGKEKDQPSTNLEQSTPATDYDPVAVYNFETGFASACRHVLQTGYMLCPRKHTFEVNPVFSLHNSDDIHDTDDAKVASDGNDIAHVDEEGKYFSDSVRERKCPRLDIPAENKCLNGKQPEKDTHLQSKPATNTPFSDEFPHVVFLGTGSACPGKVRNVTSILVRVSKDKSVLLDCGEGTLGQIVRFFGLSFYKQIIRTIRIIFISHMHADHHQGLLGIIQEWINVLEQESPRSRDVLTDSEQHEISITCPSNLCLKLQFALSTFKLDHKVHINDRSLFNSQSSDQKCSNKQFTINLCRNRALAFARTSPSHKVSSSSALNEHLQLSCDPTLSSLMASCGLTEYVTVLVDHIYDSYGIVIKHLDGWKLVFSGDCRPSQNLILAGRDADVLIHEATLETGMEDEAKVIRHCTFSEAIEVASQMCAKYTILTHFSQRYSKVPSLNLREHKNISIAFDNMIVPLGKLSLLADIIQPLRGSFSAEFEQMEQERLLKTIVNQR